MTRLTIVIPTVNRAALVARALDSALNQTAPGIEVIVSDNGSSDDTAAVLARYRDPRLRQYRHAHTMSATAHGNFLIGQASGTLFLGLSDDDYLEPDFAARVLEHFDRHPDLSFAYTGCWTHYGAVAVPGLTGPATEPGPSFIAAFFAGAREVCWCTCVTRLADLRAIGPIPDGRIFGDMFYWTQLAFRGPVGCVASPLAHYTFMTADNLSSGVPAPAWARETRALADGAIAAFSATTGDGAALRALRHDCAAFVARSTANQLVWNAIRGASRPALVPDVWECLPFVGLQLAVWPRLMSALLLPRRLLKRLIFRAATRRALQRGRLNPGRH